MIKQSSRYINDSISVVNNNDVRGVHQSVNHALPTVQSVNFAWYQLEKGETVDYIAFELYGSATLWWKIADVNPEIMDWTYLPPGTILRIPYAG